MFWEPSSRLLKIFDLKRIFLEDFGSRDFLGISAVRLSNSGILENIFVKNFGARGWFKKKILFKDYQIL